jgi:hypothetical protein
VVFLAAAYSLLQMEDFSDRQIGAQFSYSYIVVTVAAFTTAGTNTIAAYREILRRTFIKSALPNLVQF